MSDADELRQRLQPVLRQVLDVQALLIEELQPLKGGAIQENWLVAGIADGKPFGLVLRKDAASTIGSSHSRRAEFELLSAAFAAGVRVPRPMAFIEDASIIGAPFAIMMRVPGVALGRRVVRELSLGGDRLLLAETLGRELAKIHQMQIPSGSLTFLGAPPHNPIQAEIARLRHSLDALAMSRPALEWGLRWAEVTQPAAGRVTLCHRDFRTGNYLIDERGLTAILDWEFAGWSDPMADLGWFCAACWRFGRDQLEAGGIAPRAAFYRGYEAVADTRVDDQRVRFWEVLAHIRWAVIALEQGHRHASGREFSLELALTGEMAPELELAILRATKPQHWERPS